MATFRALMAELDGERTAARLRDLTPDDLPEGDVTIRVAWSSVNFKDALALRAESKVVKAYPVVPGIDLAGTVAASRDPRFREGDPVIATGYELGVSHHGGYSEYARVPGDWLVPLPKGLTLREAMILGTAGLTAAMSVVRLERHGITPDRGPVLVTGATGGVGSLAVAMLAKLGYEVTAATGKEDAGGFLRSLGAGAVIPRSELTPETIRPLGSQRWAAAVDSVGGRTLAYVLSTLRHRGVAAVSGLAGGAELPATVYPFILRGISLLGVDSAYCPREERLRLWERMAGDLKPDGLERICTREAALEELPGILADFTAGRHLGRTIVRL